MIKPFIAISALALSFCSGVYAHDANSSFNNDSLIVTASNTTVNKLLVYNAAGTLLKSIPTGGQGGVSGNSGGIASAFDHLAVVNFGSSNVSVFNRDEGRSLFNLERVISTNGSPVSVAFGHDHLYILTTTHIESHVMTPFGVKTAPDGITSLLLADGSAAQVGVLDHELIMSEKNNAIETVNLSAAGSVTGKASWVKNIPANVNAPFGLVTRGDNAYVTIAHADEISLIRNDTVLTTTASGTQHSPCWVSLDGPFMFASNSPSKSVSRYVVYGQHVIQDEAVAAQFNGLPTDIDSDGDIAAVIDSNDTASHLSIFKVSEDGDLTLQGIATIGATVTNGVAIVRKSHFDF